MTLALPPYPVHEVRKTLWRDSGCRLLFETRTRAKSNHPLCLALRIVRMFTKQVRELCSWLKQSGQFGKTICARCMLAFVRGNWAWKQGVAQHSNA